ncbi:hypothetical protein PgNI_10217 [Pyricularia grisea]|uniref:galacturonan 1,4-alpha-galacturonidase n=1 Tax=Pyricularia grisea TaxID=148305 RepID=A0A6P8AZ71_PYRGI|nr:hypothetical protein PgNI_10217 [Pyricularia grisea]TLD07589.1 hypothetical protein PgNI_10217 [Pyricularia grisea]
MDMDDSQAIREAMQKRSNGGAVVLEVKITVTKALDLTFLRHIDFATTGTIKFTDDVATLVALQVTPQTWFNLVIYMYLHTSSSIQDTDCASFKPKTSSVVVENLACTGSHGISVGSLGQYYHQVGMEEDLYV